VYRGAPVREPTIAEAGGFCSVLIDLPARTVDGLPLPYVVSSRVPDEGYATTAELADVVVKLARNQHGYGIPTTVDTYRGGAVVGVMVAVYFV
jgi:hypothetical protein